MSIEQAIDHYIEDNLDYAIDDLARLVAQRSVSAQGDGMRECAELVQTMLGERGIESELLETAGHPAIYAEADGDSDKTMLFYLHYDVQPADNREDWESDPFVLTRRDGALYGRGAIDDKGNMMARLAALDAHKAVTGSYPCKVKFVIEGEEEIGSPSLEPLLRDNRDRFSADACIWEFGGVNMQNIPQIALGLRGIAFVQFNVKTANRDLHSGLAGSIIPNAAWRLTWALSTLKDVNENILIDGFYDDVIPASDLDLRLLDRLPDTSDEMIEAYGLDNFLLGLDGGLEWKRRAVLEPTCNICGLESGYQGKGGKTITPAEAHAKVDFRLVPNQDPADIMRKLRTHLDKHGFTDVEIKMTGGYPPGRVNPAHPFVEVTRQAAADVYGVEPYIQPIIGGSGPLSLFLKYLDLPVVTAGASYPGSRVHAPNEHVCLNHFEWAIKHTARIIGRF